MKNLARYIIRASFSQKRMKYIPEEAKVTYRSKYSKEEKEFSALGWMVQYFAPIYRIGASRQSAITATIAM